jgi:hypothetical protein
MAPPRETESLVAAVTLRPLVIRNPGGPYFVNPGDLVVRAVLVIPHPRASIDGIGVPNMGIGVLAHDQTVDRRMFVQASHVIWIFSSSLVSQHLETVFAEMIF